MDTLTVHGIENNNMEIFRHGHDFYIGTQDGSIYIMVIRWGRTPRLMHTDGRFPPIICCVDEQFSHVFSLLINAIILFFFLSNSPSVDLKIGLKINIII